MHGGCQGHGAWAVPPAVRPEFGPTTSAVGHYGCAGGRRATPEPTVAESHQLPAQLLPGQRRHAVPLRSRQHALRGRGMLEVQEALRESEAQFF